VVYRIVRRLRSRHKKYLIYYRHSYSKVRSCVKISALAAASCHDCPCGSAAWAGRIKAKIYATLVLFSSSSWSTCRAVKY
jgi:hypothetical protein